MGCFFIFWLGVVFLISWPIHAFWKRRRKHSDEQNFYYEKSYWVIFLIVLTAFPLINLLITVIAIKTR